MHDTFYCNGGTTVLGKTRGICSGRDWAIASKLRRHTLIKQSSCPRSSVSGGRPGYSHVRPLPVAREQRGLLARRRPFHCLTSANLLFLPCCSSRSLCAVTPISTTAPTIGAQLTGREGGDDCADLLDNRRLRKHAEQQRTPRRHNKPNDVRERHNVTAHGATAAAA